MKISKVIRINDGNAKTLTNGGRLIVEEYPQMEEVLNSYLQNGWEVKQIVSQYEPNIQEIGQINFYLGGILVYLEKDA